MPLHQYGNHDLRKFHNELASEVRRVHGERCPCCGYHMVRPRKKSDQNQRRRDRITVAHDKPTSYGGDPTIWVYACSGCNNDQGALSFALWAGALTRHGDRRAPFVAALALVVEAFIQRKDNAKFRAPAVSVSSTASTDAGLREREAS